MTQQRRVNLWLAPSDMALLDKLIQSDSASPRTMADVLRQGLRLLARAEEIRQSDTDLPAVVTHGQRGLKIVGVLPWGHSSSGSGDEDDS